MTQLPSQEQRLALREKPSNRSVVMYQNWRDLLFAHWEIEPSVIQDTLPPGLTVDAYQGKAYLGVVPFFMCDIRPRFCPAIPGISNFLEMNVRTYVYDQQGTPGVWFYSLDANQWLAVRVARRFFHLPYFDAKMQATKGESIYYESKRKGCEGQSRFEYRELEELPAPSPDSLEFFLVERYILFAWNNRKKRLYSGQVYHTPYPLHKVDATIHEEVAIAQAGFTQPKRPPDHVLMSRGVDVDVYALRHQPLD